MITAGASSCGFVGDPPEGMSAFAKIAKGPSLGTLRATLYDHMGGRG